MRESLVSIRGDEEGGKFDEDVADQNYKWAKIGRRSAAWRSYSGNAKNVMISTMDIEGHYEDEQEGVWMMGRSICEGRINVAQEQQIEIKRETSSCGM